MITLRSVTKAFKRRPVLDGVTLDVAVGDRVALVGSNGAGKTTLIRCLLGEYTREGSIAVLGRDPRRDREKVLADIGFVPQLPPPLKMPVGELLRFAAGVCGTDPDRMGAVAEALGLDVEGARHQPFFKLSGGQKQKLLIGIALGRDCRVLILDEPAANLDPASRRTFFRLLAEKPDETIMLISSHRLDEVAALVNRVVELDRGAVVLDDHVVDRVDLASTLICTIRLSRIDGALVHALTDWGFVELGDRSAWQGRIAGPDRLRFLGMISRYAGLIAGLTLDEGGRT